MDANILGQPSLSCVNVCVFVTKYIAQKNKDWTNTVMKKKERAFCNCFP